ncbi:MAG: HNH endonuclease, partial [Betaproteobacteria bacterium]|nr:HNH endonuclease [Betaproteobacteria bacterium]
RPDQLQRRVAIGVELRKLVDNRCFYCGGRTQEADVDHFIPVAQYPRDLSHNFVLAHPSCNRSKADTLAAVKLIPAHCAASSSSPIARHMVPTLERSSHANNIMTMATSDQIKALSSKLLHPLAGK